MKSPIPFKNLRRLVLIPLLTLTMAFCLPACEDDGLSINISEAQIEGAIASYFPVHKEALMGQLQLNLQQPDLILKAGSDRAELLLKTKIIAMGSSWPAQLRLSFGVDYTPKTGTFYLVEPRLEDMAMDGVPSQISTGVVKYLLPLVQSYLTRIPVYTLDTQNSSAQNMAKKTLKKIAIKDRSLKLILGWVDAK